MQASVNERELVLDMLLQITRDGEYSHIAVSYTHLRAHET